MKKPTTVVDAAGRVCTSCGEWKPWDEYYRHSEGPNRRSPQCKTCVSARQRASERFQDYQRRYAQEHAEARRRASRERARREPERNRARVKAWRKRNPERLKRAATTWSGRRRTRLTLVRVDDIDRFAIYDRDGGRCHICKRPVSRQRFHLDHLIPIVHGGAHVAENVAVAHPSCNLRRGPGRLPAQLRMFGDV